MGLASQGGRSRRGGKKRRRNSNRGKRGGGHLVRNLAVLLLVIGGGYFGWQYVFGDDGETDAVEQPTAVGPAAAGLGGGEPLAALGAAARPRATNAPPTRATQKRPAAPQPAAAPSRSHAMALKSVATGRELAQSDRHVEARKYLNRALLSGKLSRTDATLVRADIMRINRQLVFGSRVLKQDPFVAIHRVKAGEAIGNTVLRSYNIWWDFAAQINKVQANRLQVNQPLKIIKGPFHAIVHKGAYRLDVYLGDGPTAANRMYVASVPVGLGKDDSTPAGLFLVKNRQLNPRWRDPKTNRLYLENDPDNPLGEYWVGLIGIDDSTKVLAGYGLHGTSEPESIGKQASMGCVRMREGDIRLVYSLMVPKKSKVLIVE
jgi:lipoprotein-anchoring transpeptidase ErfK/SrfK